MRYVYFTKLLKDLDVRGLIAFCKEVGLDGVDLAVRPGYPVNPENAATALPGLYEEVKAHLAGVGVTFTVLLRLFRCFHADSDLFQTSIAAYSGCTCDFILYVCTHIFR